MSEGGGGGHGERWGVKGERWGMRGSDGFVSGINRVSKNVGRGEDMRKEERLRDGGSNKKRERE